MTAVLMLAGAMMFPVAGLGLLLWLTHIEETLPLDVQRAQRRPAPPPVLAIPVDHAGHGTQAVKIPGQRTAPATEVSDPGAALAV